MNRVGINPHVEFRNRVDVSNVISSSTHDDDTGDALGNCGVSMNGERNVGERAKRYQGEITSMVV